MASATPPQSPPDSEADLRKHIASLESQLDLAYDKLSKINGNGNQRPAKRARTTEDNSTAPDADDVPDARIIRWQLQHHIDNLTDQVRLAPGPDIAESYEEQWESKLNWYDAISKPLQLVLDVGIGKKMKLKECNEILKMVADSFDALMACGAKMDTREELNESAASFELTLPWGEKDKEGKMPSILICTGMEVENAWLWIWVVLLRVHAELEREEDRYVLLQCIKDCRAHEVGPGYVSLTLEESLPEYMTEISESVIAGDLKNSPDGAALAKIVQEGGWNKLRCDRRVRVKPECEPGTFSEEEDGDDNNDDDDDDDDDDDPDDTLNETTDTLNVTGETYDEDGDDGDELNETYEDSETYDDEDDDDDGEDDRKPAALPVAAGAAPEEDEDEFGESSIEGDY